MLMILSMRDRTAVAAGEGMIRIEAGASRKPKHHSVKDSVTIPAGPNPGPRDMRWAVRSV